MNAITPAEAKNTSDAGSIMAVIAKAASDPATDVDKLERLLGMFERIKAHDAEQAFNEAMQAAQAEMPQVVKDAENKDNHSRYAKLETVVGAINPVITKHGFSMSFGTDQSPLANHYRVTCIVSRGGYSRNYHADIPADSVGLKGNPNKTATHAFGSTMSYGRRYLTLLIFNVATKNEDDDGNAASRGEAINEQQLAELRRVIMDADADIPKFLKVLRIERLDDLPGHRFAEAVEALNILKAKRQRAKAETVA